MHSSVFPGIVPEYNAKGFWRGANWCHENHAHPGCSHFLIFQSINNKTNDSSGAGRVGIIISMLTEKILWRVIRNGTSHCSFLLWLERNSVFCQLWTYQLGWTRVCHEVLAAYDASFLYQKFCGVNYFMNLTLKGKVNAKCLCCLHPNKTTEHLLLC